MFHVCFSAALPVGNVGKKTAEASWDPLHEDPMASKSVWRLDKSSKKEPLEICLGSASRDSLK